MNLKELHFELIRLGIPEDGFYLHGLYGSTDDNDKPALTIKKGKYSQEYETYYKERGEKHSVRTFTNEDDACRFIHKMFKATE